MDVEIIRSDRKTVSLEVRPDGSAVVRAPRRMPEKEIMRFVESKRDWYENVVARRAAEIKEARDEGAVDVERLRALAKASLPQRVAFYAAVLGVTPGKITVRQQKTRWGSCSAEGNLSFNCLLMLAPTEVIDYVVVHELCHVRHHDHSRAFWNEVGRIIPDYAARRRWLKDNGNVIMMRAE